jgi:antitoxin VapB
MGLRIKDAEVERLALEVAALAGETKTEAIRVALLQRKHRLLAGAHGAKRRRLDKVLRERIWPQIPNSVLGRTITKRQKERMLGYGPASA